MASALRCSSLAALAAVALFFTVCSGQERQESAFCEPTFVGPSPDCVIDDD